MAFLITMQDGSQALAHHGILGMKWGVHNEETQRKYGEISGNDLETGNSSSKSSENYELLYELSQGFIEDFETSGKIPGFYGKSGMANYDSIPTERLHLGPDTTFTSYGADDKAFDGPLYATWKDDAKYRYKNFGNTMYEFSPKKDFEVASMKDSFDTFTDMFKDDGDDGSAFRRSVYEERLGPFWAEEKIDAFANAAKDYPEAAAADAYRSFVDTQYKQKTGAKMFFKRMEDSGFDGILDQHDISDYTKQSPVIVLNPRESLEMKARTLMHEEVPRGMAFLITMNDGSQALAHHGVQGMKWGVWNDETKAKYGYSGHSAKGDKLRRKAANQKALADKARSNTALVDRAARVHTGEITKHYSTANAHLIKGNAHKSMASGLRAEAEAQKLAGKERKAKRLEKKAAKQDFKAKNEKLKEDESRNKGRMAANKFEREEQARRELAQEAQKRDSKAAKLEKRAERADIRADKKAEREYKTLQEASKDRLEDLRKGKKTIPDPETMMEKFFAPNDKASADHEYAGITKQFLQTIRDPNIKDSRIFESKESKQIRLDKQEARLRQVMTMSLKDVGATTKEANAIINDVLDQAVGYANPFRNV